MTTIDLAQLDRFGRLQSGWHEDLQDGVNIMEAVSYVAGEPWSSTPACTCPVLRAFAGTWNDDLPDDERDTLLRPLIPRLVGTRSTPAVMERRAMMAADWLVRVHAPAWLRLAKLDVHADVLAALPEITDMAQALALYEPLDTVRLAVDAVRVASRDKTWDAAADAAWLATEGMGQDAWRASAGGGAAIAAAVPAREGIHGGGGCSPGCTAARDAASIAAWHATSVAAWDALSATQHDLQQSALRLVDRMLEV